MQYVSTSKDNCVNGQTFDDFELNGPNECGAWFGTLFFISFIVLVPMMMMNIIIVIVIEGYSECLKEYEAVISPAEILFIQ